MLTRSRQCQNQKKPVEAQNYHLIYLQLWALFPGFCSLPTDAKTAFPAMAKDLGQLINSNPEVRPTVCSGLINLIEKNLEIKGDVDASVESVAAATEAVEVVAKFAKNFLPILFNIYSSLNPQTRGFVLEVVRSYFKVTDSELLSGFFKNAMKKVLTLFNSTEQLTPEQLEEKHALFDLIVAMAPHLTAESVLVLYRLVKTNWQSEDLVVQKKAYKAMGALLEAGHYAATIGSSPDDLQTLLLDATLSASSASKKQRLGCLMHVVEHLPDDDLHLIPSFLPEVILGTKETNEQARQTAFDLLLALAHRMERGGKINMDVFDEVAEADEAEAEAPKAKGKAAKKAAATKQEKASGATVEASVEEFMKMVVAGLAGSSQHMMSATLTCLARLVYEYLESLRFEIIEQIIESVVILLHSKSRELIKSVLGFIKMIIVSLDADDLGPFVPDIVNPPSSSHLFLRLQSSSLPIS